MATFSRDNPVLFETVEVPKKSFTLKASCEDDSVNDTPVRLYQLSEHFLIESGELQAYST